MAVVTHNYVYKAYEWACICVCFACVFLVSHRVSRNFAHTLLMGCEWSCSISFVQRTRTMSERETDREKSVIHKLFSKHSSFQTHLTASAFKSDSLPSIYIPHSLSLFSSLFSRSPSAMLSLSPSHLSPASSLTPSFCVWTPTSTYSNFNLRKCLLSISTFFIQHYLIKKKYTALSKDHQILVAARQWQSQEEGDFLKISRNIVQCIRWNLGEEGKCDFPRFSILQHLMLNR